MRARNGDNYLTLREIASVRAYLSAGTHKDAAVLLSCSTQTLKNHLQSAYKRRSVSNFGQLVDALHRDGTLRAD